MTPRRIIVAATATALAVCYASVLRGMFEQWWHDEDMGYALVVLPVIFWIIWKDRRRWLQLPIRPNSWGMALLAAAAGVHLMSAMGAGLFVGSIAFVLSAAGAVIWLGGFALLRAWAFPFLLTLFMLPKLAIVYYQVTLPLQSLASRLAEAALLAGGALVTRDGNIIDIAGRRVEVVEACSGIRYILPLGFVAVVFAYVSGGKPWMRVALPVAAIPIAICANAIRIAAVVCMPALDSERLHAFAGALVFVLCLASLLLVRRLLRAGFTSYHV